MRNDPRFRERRREEIGDGGTKEDTSSGRGLNAPDILPTTDPPLPPRPLDPPFFRCRNPSSPPARPPTPAGSRASSENTPDAGRVTEFRITYPVYGSAPLAPSFAGTDGCAFYDVSRARDQRVHPLDANHSPGVKIITAINPGRKGRMATEGKDAPRAERRESEKGCKVVGRRGEGEGSGGLRVARWCGERRRRRRRQARARQG